MLRLAGSRLSLRLRTVCINSRHALKLPIVPLASQARQITTVQHIPKRRRWPLYLLGLTVAGLYGYWKWLTHHNFPPTVAALLRDGLWATINGAGYRKPDYRKALGKYIEALQEADRLKMIPWSDEYTGIQILIADLYERLNLSKEAASMYAEVANTYLMALNKGLIPPEDIDRIITRDLRVALLAGLLISSDADLKAAVNLMGPHLVMATREAAKKSEELQYLLLEQPMFNTSYLRDIRTKQLPDDVLEDCWGSYRNELVAMREMMTGIAAANGEYMQALTIKLKTTQIMLTSGFPAGECLLSAVNIASLMYLQSVNLRFTRSQRIPLTDDKLAEINEENDSFDEMKPPFKPLLKSQTIANPPGTPTKPRKMLEPTAETFLKMANDVYEEILKTVKSLDQKRTDFVPETYAMALYGQGVIATSTGDWKLAADRFEEARLRAKGSEIQSLIGTVEDEIAKLEKLKDLSPEKIQELNPTELPNVDVMFWKLMPESDDISRPELPTPRF